MKLKILFLVFMVVCLASSLALADCIVLPCDASWIKVPCPDGKQPPFWDNPSLDGKRLNVGYILTGRDPLAYSPFDWIDYGLKNSAGDAQYLGTKGGGVVNNVYFKTPSPNTGQGAFLIIEIAGYAGGNRFGVYDISAKSFNPLVSDAYHMEIFSGGATGGSSWSDFVPYAHYGFYFYSQAGNLFLSDPTTDLKSADKDSNFAFFRSTLQPDYYYIGMEDLKQSITGEGCLGDYNDMVVRIHCKGDANVPVPASALLLGSGLLGLVLLGWRKKT